MPVPSDGLVGADGVVLGAVVLVPLGEGDGAIELVGEELLALQTRVKSPG